MVGFGRIRSDSVGVAPGRGPYLYDGLADMIVFHADLNADFYM